jgi:Arc/MetJ-type ribon-helix-helix transcriptional regulator
MTMVALRLPEETVDHIDQLVAAGWSINRTAFVREAIEAALADAVEAQLDRQIAAALDRVEESPADMETLKASSRAWIASLPDEDW